MATLYTKFCYIVKYLQGHTCGFLMQGSHPRTVSRQWAASATAFVAL
jgi:hypothetical protein